MKSLYIYILPVILAVLLAESCKKDKGNYSYKDVPLMKIDTTGIGATKYIQGGSILSLDPVVWYDGGKLSDLKYEWLIYPTPTSSTATTVPSKSISTQKKLEVPIIETVGEYNLELIVTDTVNLLKVNTVFKVSVSVGLDYGWMVMHTTGTDSDIDFLVTTNAFPLPGISTKRLRNIYSTFIGKKISGIPRFIAQERRNFTRQDWLMIASSNQMTRVKGSNFSFMRENSGFFRSSGQVMNPQNGMLLASGYFALINDGKLQLYTSNYEVDALFGTAVGGDYELAPYFAYGSSTSIISPVYDQKHGKFIRPAAVSGNMVDFLAPAFPDFAPFDLRNIGKDMLYMDRGFGGNTHCFFKDKTGDGRWMYLVNFKGFVDDGQLALTKKDMSLLTDIKDAKFYQVSELGYNILYATDRKIYSYDYMGTNTAKIVYNEFPANEVITCMRIYKPRPNIDLSASDGKILYVATWNGTEGKVYEFDYNAISGEINATPLNVFDGFGKVVDMTPKAKGKD